MLYSLTKCELIGLAGVKDFLAVLFSSIVS